MLWRCTQKDGEFEFPIKFLLAACVPMWNGGSGAATQTLEEDVQPWCHGRFVLTSLVYQLLLRRLLSREVPSNLGAA